MIKFFKHYFIPHSENNHRSKILHNSSLFALIILLLASSIFSILLNRSNPQILGISYSMTDQELLMLVNQERIEAGKEPLELNEELNSAARNKASHMFENDYWAHFAPDNTSPWKFITDSGYNYVYAGENLAKGFTTAEDTVEAWMNSPAHKENILSDEYSDVGFAIVEGTLQGEETLLIVEMFGKERTQFLADAEVGELEEDNSDESTGALSDSNVNETVEIPLLGTNNSGVDIESQTQTNLYQSSPFLDTMLSAKTISFILISILLIAFVLDLFVVAKKKIPRNVGNNLDHIFILSIFIVFMFMYNLGNIL